jgi:uncharacterized repeat protein (TIGR01451 family)
LPLSYFGASSVFAAVETYDFNTAGEYTTDSQVAIFDGTAAFNLTWDTSADSIAAGDTVVDLLASTDVDGLVMATTGKGTLLRSTDYGATWGAIVTGPSFSAHSIIQTTTNNMLLVGSDTPDNKIYRSTDDGASWTPSTTSFADSFVGVAHDDTTTSRNWAIDAVTGTVYTTADSSDNWAGLAGEGLDTGGDVMWYSGNVIFASGTTGGAGALVYSDDSGGTWTDLSSKLPGTPATLLNKIEKFGSNIFVSGTGYVAKITISSNINEVETAANWTNLTTNINANSGDDINFSTVGGILRTNTGVIALSVLDTDASEGRIISSIDGGTDWHRHADPGTYSTPGDLVRLPTDGRFLWGIKNSGGTGDAEGLLSNLMSATDSLVATTGISASSIESIDVTYHSTSEITDIGMVLGFTTADDGTWYYDDAVTAEELWISTTTDNVSNSVGQTIFNSIIANFDESPGISGDVYFKFYTAKQPNSADASTYTNSLTVIESIAVTYTEDSGGGGGGPAVDTEAPSSLVNSLPAYSTSSPFTVTVVATDNKSGVAEVSLWYSIDVEPGPLEGETILAGTSTNGPAGTYSFEFYPPRDGTYYFVSSAVDIAGNDNSVYKPVNLPAPCQFCFMPSPPPIEASTIVDTNKPQIIDQHPFFNEQDVALSGDIIVRFNEPMDPTTFGILLVEGTGPDRPGEAVYLPLTDADWTQGNTVVTFGYGNNAGEQPLNQDYDYRIKIDGTDPAGNELNLGEGSPTEPPLYYAWPFKTLTLQDPDLRSSTIEVVNENGPFEVGDPVGYKVSIINTGQLSAYATAELTFADSLVFDDSFGALTASSGTVLPTIIDGVTVGWTWSGWVYPTEGTPPDGAPLPWRNVYIYYWTTVSAPVNDLNIVQNVTINDGITASFSKNVMIAVAEDTNFADSNKSVDQPTADPTDILTYTVTVSNIGPTVGWVRVSDLIPTGVTYVGISNTGAGWDSLEYLSSENRIAAELNAIYPDEENHFSFEVVVNDGTEGGTITNTAQISSVALPEPNGLLVSATTTINSSPVIPGNPPQLINQSPLNNAQAVPLTEPITASFSKDINQSSFSYQVDYNGSSDWNPNWTVSWTTNRSVSISPSIDWEIGTDYTVTIITAEDAYNQNFELTSQTANPWTFTSVYPQVTITTPTYTPKMLVNTTKAYNAETNTYEDLEFKVGLRDFYTGEAYTAGASGVTIGFGFSDDSGGSIGLTAGFTNGVSTIIIPSGESEASFYYKSSVVSDPYYASITTLEIPHVGWADDTKEVMVTGESDTIRPTLNFHIESHSVNTNELSDPITITARDNGNPTPLPSRLYFYSTSTTGVFYEDLGSGTIRPLDKWVKILSINSTDNLYVYNIASPIQYTATFFYRDSVAGVPVLTVGDNAPLSPDTGDFNNVSSAITILDVEIVEIELEEDLEEVEDETGRIITTVEVDPTEIYTLPNGVQTFVAKGYDQFGKEIPELKFKWYTLAGGGNVQKDGLSEDNHKTAFVAGDQPGVYYDTVMAATLYNGEIGYATASVYIVDVTAIGGPTSLPVTGMSGLQLIFIAMTLAAAVALAWVESYEKQHFSATHK